MHKRLIDMLGIEEAGFEKNEPNDRFLDLEAQVEYNIMMGNLEDPSEEENDE